MIDKIERGESLVQSLKRLVATNMRDSIKVMPIDDIIDMQLKAFAVVIGCHLHTAREHGLLDHNSINIVLFELLDVIKGAIKIFDEQDNLNEEK